MTEQIKNEEMIPNWTCYDAEYVSIELTKMTIEEEGKQIEVYGSVLIISLNDVCNKEEQHRGTILITKILEEDKIIAVIKSISAASALFENIDYSISVVDEHGNLIEELDIDDIIADMIEDDEECSTSQ